jgi:hypothetical protein
VLHPRPVVTALGHGIGANKLVLEKVLTIVVEPLLLQFGEAFVMKHIRCQRNNTVLLCVKVTKI